MEAGYYNSIDNPATAEYKERGSRFIAYSFPVNDLADCKHKLAEVKKEHPKATHHCFAWRLGLEGNSFRVSDDGEPSGSAGRPILGQMDSKELTNILVVVVRYFGGTMLGIPGLINAYKTSASLVLQVNAIVRKPVLLPYQLQFDYMQMNTVMRVVKQLGCMVLKQEAQLFCLVELGIPQSRKEEVLQALKEIRGLEISKK